MARQEGKGGAVIVIPARYASSRFPGKPLAELELPDGGRKSLIRLSWEAACRVPGIVGVHVATDDDRIRAACDEFGASTIMTSQTCKNGTERCAEALERAGLAAEVVVNLQGDAPLTPPWFVEAILAAMSDPAVQVSTPVLPAAASAHAHLMDDRRKGLIGATTAVFDVNWDALYFSKEVLPRTDLPGSESAHPIWHHVGLYAYRPDALTAYRALPEGSLERAEGLEQLRFLEHGMKVRCVPVEARDRAFWELNNPSDVPRIEKALKEQFT